MFPGVASPLIPSALPSTSRSPVPGGGATAGVTHEARRNNATLAATQIVQLLADGQRPARLVNPEVWPQASARIAAALGH